MEKIPPLHTPKKLKKQHICILNPIIKVLGESRGDFFKSPLWPFSVPQKGHIMENLGYYNGKFGLLDEMVVPFNDRVHFFGDGVYEACPARNHIPFALDEHIDRMYRSASMVDIHIPCTKAEMKEILCDMIRRVDSHEQFVYWQVTRGTAMRNHTYAEDMKGNLWISLKPAPLKPIGKEVAAITAEDTRFLHCNIKTLNLLPAVWYSQAAERAGVYETILYRKAAGTAADEIGACRVTECAHSNVHIINRDGVFQTAPTDNLILPGIARAHLLRACRDLGIETSETPFTVDELMGAREVIISSSSAPALRCTAIDGKAVGGEAPETLGRIMDWVREEFLRETEA